MFNKRAKQLMAVIMSAAVLFGETQTARAAEYDVLEEDVLIEEITEEDISDELILGEDIYEEVLEDEEGSDVSCNSAEEAFYSNDEFDQLTEGVDYVADEVVCLADSEEEAWQVAEFYGGVLKSFAYGVAVIDLAKSDTTVASAYLEAKNNSLELPAVEPNFISKEQVAEDELGSEGFDLEESECLSSIMSTSRGSYDAVYGKILNDPYLDPSNLSYYQFHHDTIGSFDAWMYTTGDKNIVVALMDTGVAADHAELRSRIAGSNWNGNSNTDSVGSGTFHAALIACQGNDGIGGAGVAPNAKVLPIKIRDDSDTKTNELFLKGCRYIAGYDVSGKKVADRRADIACVSAAFSFYSKNQEQVVQDCINAGITVVAPIGDHNSNEAVYPAGFKNVIGVGAVDKTLAKSYYSNYGSQCDIAAPGMFLSALSVERSKYTSSYEASTENACAIVAGSCALYMSYVGHVSPKTMEKEVKANATKLDDKGLGAGIINVGKMIKNSDKAKRSPFIPISSEPFYVAVSGQSIISPGCKGTFKIVKNISSVKFSKITWSLKGAPAGVKISSKGVVTVPKNTAPASDVLVVAAVTDKETGFVYNVSTPFQIKAKNTKVTVSANRKTISTAVIHGLKKQAELAATADVDVSAIKWISSDPKIATVSGKGANAVVTAKRSGTVTITAKSNDGGKAKASVKLKVITPPSDFHVQAAKRQVDYVVPAGGSIQFKPVFGTTFGPVSNKKVEWYYGFSVRKNNRWESVSNDTERKLKRKKAFCTFSNGKLKVKSQAAFDRDLKKYAKEFKELQGVSEIEIFVTACTTDGSGFSAGTNVYVSRKAKYLSFNESGDKKAMTINVTAGGDIKIPFYTDINSDYGANFQLTSSDPKVCSGYCQDENSIVIQPRKKGSAVLTLKANDGSGKTAKIKVKVN
jgi:hypothetical protein